MRRFVLAFPRRMSHRPEYSVDRILSSSPFGCAPFRFRSPLEHAAKLDHWDLASQSRDSMVKAAKVHVNYLTEWRMRVDFLCSMMLGSELWVCGASTWQGAGRCSG